MGGQTKIMKCPVCNKRGWYYDPFAKLWKCSKCTYEHENMYGKMFCYYCGDWIKDKNYHLKIEDDAFLFWHNKCWDKVLSEVLSRIK